jgi:hypothetical protein
MKNRQCVVLTLCLATLKGRPYKCRDVVRGLSASAGGESCATVTVRLRSAVGGGLDGGVG